LCWILSVFIRSYAFLILFFANISVISVPSVADVFDCGYAALCSLRDMYFRLVLCRAVHICVQKGISYIIQVNYLRACNPSVTGGWPRSEEERFGVKAKGTHGRGVSPVRLES